MSDIIFAFGIVSLGCNALVLLGLVAFVIIWPEAALEVAKLVDKFLETRCKRR